MKIAHISDLHIRNFKYRDEYNVAFENLYVKLRELKPDLIINTGDTVHSKLAVSPELFDDVANHCRKISEIAPYWLILGNHDLNLKNTSRTDAISPVINAIQGSTKNKVTLLGIPASYEIEVFPGFVFWNYEIRHINHIFTSKTTETDINIGLYHGSISGCMTDIGFIMEDGEAEVSKFNDMDYVMLGDIHKRQSFRDGRIQYPGSLIQQNYGEELIKGFLLWDIKSKTEFTCDFHAIDSPGRFYTIQVPSALDLSNIAIPKGSRIRAVVDGELSPSKRIELEKKIREAYSPIEIITPDSSGECMKMEAPDIDLLVGSREKLMLSHLADHGVCGDSANEVVALFKQYENGLDSDSAARGTTWQLKKIAWDNMLNYGEGNTIDMSKLSGLVGIFAPNASGKSSIFDIVLESLFDKIAKEVPRNIDLVNDNKDIGSMFVEFESKGEKYEIDRKIERIHYGQRKLSETKQWGKTSLDLSRDREGLGLGSLNGTSRPETEKTIRSIIGTFEDFALTTMVTQSPIFGLPGGADILNCRETDRRKILFRFLDLDIYEQISAAVKDDLKEILGKIKIDRAKLENNRDSAVINRSVCEIELDDLRSGLMFLEDKLSGYKQKLLSVESVEDAIGKVHDLQNKALSTLDIVNSIKTRLSREEASREKTQFNIDDLNIRKPTSAEIALDDLSNQTRDVQQKLEIAKAELSKQKNICSSGKKSLKTLDDIPCERKFPSCKFIADATNFIDQRDEIESTILLLTGEVDSMQKNVRILEQQRVVHHSIALWEKNLANEQLMYSRFETSITKLSSSFELASNEHAATIKQLDEAKKALDLSSVASIADLRINEAKCISSIAKNKHSTEALLRTIGVLQAEEDAANKDIRQFDALKEQAKNYEALAEMCGKNGLPYRILTMVLPIINAEISKILNGVVKFSVFFENDEDEQTVSLFIRYGDYKSRPLSLGSGAEKFIASLAVRVALLSVSSLPKTDILIIDEGFGKLDSEHLEALQKMFEYLKSAFGVVFIVSHVDFMRDIVDHSIEITSFDGYAHVEV